MKKTNFLFTSALLIAVSLVSCSKKDDNGSNTNNGGSDVKSLVTFTINGGSFKKDTPITLNNLDTKSLQNGAFSGNSGYLKINIDDATDKTAPKWGIDIAVQHAGTGETNVGSAITNNVGIDKQAYLLVEIQENGATKTLQWDHQTPTKTPGTIKVTKFESVGGTVEGNFQGTFLNAGITYAITNGHFITGRKS